MGFWDAAWTSVIPGRIKNCMKCCLRLAVSVLNIRREPGREESFFLQGTVLSADLAMRCSWGSLIFLEGVQGQLWEILDFNPLPVQELQRRYEERYGKAIAFPILYKELLELCTDGYAGQVGGGHFMRTMKT